MRHVHTEGENRYKLGVAELMEAKDGAAAGRFSWRCRFPARRWGGLPPAKCSIAPGAGVDGALRVV